MADEHPIVHATPTAARLFSKCSVRIATFVLSWLIVAAMVYFLNDPYHNDEGSLAGLVLSVLILTISPILYYYFDRLFIKKSPAGYHLY